LNKMTVDMITNMLAVRKQELMISDLTSTIREQDHALTTLTQEKRELQLQMRSNEETHVCPRCPPGMRNLRRISEHTEPASSRESSLESCGVRIEEVTDDDDDYFEDSMHNPHVDYLSVVTEEDVSKLSPSPSGCSSSEHKTMSTSEEDELQVPRDYYVCHTPDQVFPGESMRPERCRSLQPIAGRTPPTTPAFFCRAVSCPGRWFADGSIEDDWGD